MTDDESEAMMNSMFPVGQERWIKFRYLDRDKCIKAFLRSMSPNHEKSRQLAEESGYEVTAIGVRDEYTPQISALMDIKDLLPGLENYTHIESVLDAVRYLLNEKIDELKARMIKPLSD